MPEHNTLTGSQLHWPRGTDTASAGQVFVADGSNAGSFQTLSTLIQDENTVLAKVKTSDTVFNTDNTLANDSSLASYTLDASSTYKVDGVILYDSADGTTGAQFKVNLSSGTLSASGAQYISSKSGDNSVVSSGAVALTDTVTVASPGGSSTVEVRISGYVTTSTESVLSLQTAQDTSVATDTTFRQGSHLTFTKV